MYINNMINVVIKIFIYIYYQDLSMNCLRTYYTVCSAKMRTRNTCDRKFDCKLDFAVRNRRRGGDEMRTVIYDEQVISRAFRSAS